MNNAIIVLALKYLAHCIQIGEISADKLKASARGV